MEMSLIHAGLAAGAALAALPVILHLFMRQTPKHIIFPALRLLRERQKQSLNLQRENILSQKTSNPGRRAALEAALAQVEAQMDTLK